MKVMVINMALAYESNTNLALDTEVFKKCGSQYSDIASELRKMSKELDACLTELGKNGWTTPAGTAFHTMVNTSWSNNIEKYAGLLDTLKEILYSAAFQYDNLVQNQIETTQL